MRLLLRYHPDVVCIMVSSIFSMRAGSMSVRNKLMVNSYVLSVDGVVVPAMLVLWIPAPLSSRGQASTGMATRGGECQTSHPALRFFVALGVLGHSDSSRMTK